MRTTSLCLRTSVVSSMASMWNLNTIRRSMVTSTRHILCSSAVLFLLLLWIIIFLVVCVLLMLIGTLTRLTIFRIQDFTVYQFQLNWFIELIPLSASRVIVLCNDVSSLLLLQWQWLTHLTSTYKFKPMILHLCQTAFANIVFLGTIALC